MALRHGKSLHRLTSTILEQSYESLFFLLLVSTLCLGMTTVRSNNARQQNPYYCRTVLNPSIFQIILDKLNEGGPFVIDNPTVRQALHVV